VKATETTWSDKDSQRWCCRNSAIANDNPLGLVLYSDVDENEEQFNILGDGSL
jgi:hypothetical protein